MAGLMPRGLFFVFVYGKYGRDSFILIFLA